MPLACPLDSTVEPITLVPGTRMAALYRDATAAESFRCGFGVNPNHVPLLEGAGLRVTARGPEGEVRGVELPGHPFFMATLFLPQLRSTSERPHPVLAGFRDAVTARPPDGPVSR